MVRIIIQVFHYSKTTKALNLIGRIPLVLTISESEGFQLETIFSYANTK
jgi:hypothetical protein